MPVLFEEALKKDISSGDFAPVYILYGDDSYLKKHYTDVITNKICGDDTVFNYRHIERNVDLQELYDSVNQFPIMADKKCVLVDDYDFEHADKTHFDAVCSIIEDCPESCVLILKFDAFEFDAKHSSKSKKLLSCAEKCGGAAICLNHRSQGQLKAMVMRGAKSRGCEMPDSVAGYMIETVGEDITVLQNELEKLCSFTGSGTITKDTVNLVCAKTVEASVYDYVENIIACNITEALKTLDGMFYMHIEPMIILSTAASSFVDIYRCYAAGNNVNKADIAESFEYGSRAFLLDRARRNLRKFDISKIKRCFDALLSADKEIKSFSGNERTVLEQLTVKLGYIIATGGDGLD